MRRLVTVICALMILSCSACSAVRSTELNNTIHEFFTAAALTATCAVRVDHGDSVSDYVIECEFGTDEHRFTVREPLLLQGLTVRIGADFTVSYAGSVFVPQMPQGTALSPVRILSDLYVLWQSGYAEGAELTQIDGEDTVFWESTSVKTGETLFYRTWFSNETKMPLRAECFCGGTLILTVEFSDCQRTKFEE